MEKEALSQLTNEELLVEKKKLKQSKLFHAVAIGFLGGVFIFGMISWALSSEKRIVFFIPMLIPLFFIYKVLKSPDKGKVLEEVLKERGLS